MTYRVTVCPECGHGWLWHFEAGCSADVDPSCVCPVRVVRPVVVHPEPGDRARAETAMSDRYGHDTVSDHHWSDEEWAAYEQGVIAASKKGDARVAAAVAAVRADLAAKAGRAVEELREGPDAPMTPEFRAGYETGLHDAAAAVRSATTTTED